MAIRRHSVWILAAVSAILSPLSAIPWPQEKLAAEIAGDYDLQLDTRILPFKILLKEGKLFFDALVPGGDPQALVPVQGQELKFTTSDPNGDEVVLTFAKDPQGKITGCTVFIPVRNAEATAVKVVRRV